MATLRIPAPTPVRGSLREASEQAIGSPRTATVWRRLVAIFDRLNGSTAIEDRALHPTDYRLVQDALFY
ncbi:MAG: hypothetical protein HY261_04525 [Chloroflexi bacterium]|nr:hypothetical protein [Chloroflexota bacterium]